MLRQIRDWDDAYSNGPHIAGGDRFPDAWAAAAAAFRSTIGARGRAELDLAYGPKPRNRFDLFLPEASPCGLVVFVHGGYWMAFDNSAWSHLAAGPLARGWAVAMPSYTLCPEARIADIAREVGAAVAAAMARVRGPVALSGHSAGGHLVARLVSSPSPLATADLARVRTVLPISGLADLRPLLLTTMNATLRLTEEEAARESPALLRPASDARLVAWVGGAERAEFRRQSALLANVWAGLGAPTTCVEEPDRHHFDVVDGLADHGHPLIEALVG